MARWNQHADTVAGLANLNRPAPFALAHAAATQHWQHLSEVLRAPRSVYDAIAIATQGEVRRALHAGDHCELDGNPVPEMQVREETLSELLPLCWQDALGHLSVGLPNGFLIRLMQLLLDLDACSTGVFRLSWLEILMIFILDGGLEFPVVSSSGDWVDRNLVPFAGQPLTLGARLTLLRRAVRSLVKHFGCEHICINRLSLVELGFWFPLGGILLGCSEAKLGQARKRLYEFAHGRKCDTVASLSVHCDAGLIQALIGRTMD